MALHINNPQADKLVREVAALTGTTNTEAIINAMEAQLVTLKTEAKDKAAERLTADAKWHAEVEAIIDEYNSYPVINEHLTDDEILGYPEMFPEMYPEYNKQDTDAP